MKNFLFQEKPFATSFGIFDNDILVREKSIIKHTNFSIIPKTVKGDDLFFALAKSFYIS